MSHSKARIKKPVGKKKTLEQYFRIKAINWSTLKEVERSLLRYAWRLENPREDCALFARGRGVHTAVLEPEKYITDYVIFPGPVRRGKEWEAFEAANAGKTILKPEEHAKCWAAAESVKKNREAMELLRDAQTEMTFTREIMGEKCKSRLDGIGSVLFDIKTTGDIDTRVFGLVAARLMYHGQIAMYADVAGYTGDVFIIGVEREPPFEVAVYQVEKDELELGREVYQGMLQKVADARKSGVWSGKYDSVQKLELAKFAYADDSQEDGTAVIVEEAA